MEKYSKATQDFFKSLSETKKDVEQIVHDPDAHAVVRTARLAKNPIALPKALLAYALTKEGTSLDEEIHPVDLKDYLVDNHNIEWLDWVPGVLEKTIFGSEDVNEILRNKIQAVRICLTTDTPWQDWNIFENVGVSFNHQVPDFGTLQPLSVGECLTTMNAMKALRADEEFSEEVLSYVASIATNGDFVYLPKDTLLGKAQTILDSMIHDLSLRGDVEEAWEKVKGHDILNLDYKSDNALQVQLGKLAMVSQYNKEYNERR